MARRRGAVTVEFAVCVPILFLAFFFFWEFARAEMIRQTAATAAYEGARQGIVEGATAADVQNAAQSILNAVAIQGAVITVTPATITSETTSVQVAIRVPLNSNAWITPLFMDNMNVNSSITLSR